jgi:hypothetical protein
MVLRRACLAPAAPLKKERGHVGAGGFMGSDYVWDGWDKRSKTMGPMGCHKIP